MSALQEVVQQLEDILKTCNQYGPFVCLDASLPVNVLPVNTNGQCSTDEGDGIQTRREASPELLQCDRDVFMSRGLGLVPQGDNDDEVIYVEESEAIETFEWSTNGLVSQGSDDISNGMLYQGAPAFQVQEGGTVTALSPVPSICEVNPLSDALLQNCDINVLGHKYGLDGKDGKGKVNERVEAVQPMKRKRGRPRKSINPNPVQNVVKRSRGRPRKIPATDVKMSAASVPNDAIDQYCTLPKEIESQDLFKKDLFNKGSSCADEVSPEMFVEMQQELQNGIPTIPKTYCDSPMPKSYLRAERPVATCLSRKELILETNVPDDLNNCHETGVNIDLDKEEPGTATKNCEADPQRTTEQPSTTDTSLQNSSESSLHFDKCGVDCRHLEGSKEDKDKANHPTKRKRARPVKVPATNVKIGTASIPNDAIDQWCTLPKAIEIQESLEKDLFNDGSSCADEVSLAMFAETQQELQNGIPTIPNTYSDKECGVDVRNMEGNKEDKDKADHRTKRKRGRPRKTIISNAVPEIQRQRARPIEVPATNVKMGTASVPNDAIDQCCTLPKAIESQESLEKGLFNDGSSCADEVGLEMFAKMQQELQNGIPTIPNTYSDNECGVDVRNMEENKGDKDTADHPTKRKRGRPRKAIIPNDVPEIERQRARPIEVPANVKMGTASVPNDAIDQCCTFPKPIESQESLEKDLFNDGSSCADKVGLETFAETQQELQNGIPTIPNTYSDKECGVDVRNMEGNKEDKDEADHPTKRKRRRPRKPTIPNAVPEIQRQRARPIEVPATNVKMGTASVLNDAIDQCCTFPKAIESQDSLEKDLFNDGSSCADEVGLETFAETQQELQNGIPTIPNTYSYKECGVDVRNMEGNKEDKDKADHRTKRKRGRPRKTIIPNTVPEIQRQRARLIEVPATNVKMVSASVPNDAIDQCCTLPKAIESQESLEKDLFNDGSSCADKVGLETFAETQQELQNGIPTIPNTYSDKECGVDVRNMEGNKEDKDEADHPTKRKRRRPRKPIIPNAVPEIQRQRARPIEVPANVKMGTASVLNDAIDQCCTFPKAIESQDSLEKDLFNDGSSCADEVGLETFAETQQELQNGVPTIPNTYSDNECGVDVRNMEGNKGDKDKADHPTKRKRGRPRKTIISNAVPEIQRQRARPIEVPATNVKMGTASVPNDAIDQCCTLPKAIESQESLEKGLFNDGSSCADEVGLEMFAEMQQEIQNGIRTIPNTYSDNECGVDVRNMEENKGDKDTADHLTKRKRGRPRKAIIPNDVTEIERQRARPIEVPATNVKMGTASVPNDAVDQCCTLPKAIESQESLEKDLFNDGSSCADEVGLEMFTEMQRKLQNGIPTIPNTYSDKECGVDVRNMEGNKEDKDKADHPTKKKRGRPRKLPPAANVEIHVDAVPYSDGVNHCKTLESETNEVGQDEMSRQEWNDSSEHHSRGKPKKNDLWEKETAAVNNAIGTALREQVPKLRLRRKTTLKIKETPDHSRKTQRLFPENVQSIIPIEYTARERSSVNSSPSNAGVGDEVLQPSGCRPKAPPVQIDEQEIDQMIQKRTVVSEDQRDTSLMQMSDEEVVSNLSVHGQEQCKKVTDRTNTSEALPGTEAINPKHFEATPTLNASTGCSLNALFNTSEKTNSNQTVAYPATVKRGRGRPRKNTLRNKEEEPGVSKTLEPIVHRSGSQRRCLSARRKVLKKTVDQVYSKSTEKEVTLVPHRSPVPAITSTGGGKLSEMQNGANPDNPPSSIPKDNVHKETEIRLDLKRDAIKSLDELSEINPASAQHGLPLGLLPGKDIQEGLNQEMEVMKADCKLASSNLKFTRISQRPVTVQRVVPVVCSSETEMLMHKENQGTASTISGLSALPLQKDEHRSMLILNGCMKKPSVRIKKLPNKLIAGPFNLDNHSRLAKFMKDRDISTRAGYAHQSTPVKLTTPLSSGGRVITPYAHEHVQSYTSTSVQKTVKLTYGEQNGQTTKTSDGTGKCLSPIKNRLKHPPLPYNSVETLNKGKYLIMDRIKKDAGLLQDDCFQNKRAASMSPIAKTKSNSEKRGREFVSLTTRVKQQIIEFHPKGPLFISKHLFSTKRKVMKDMSLSTKQFHGALVPEKCVPKRRGRPKKHVEHFGSTPSGAKSVEACLIGTKEFGKKFGRLLTKSGDSDNALSSTCSNRKHKGTPKAACIKIARKVGRPRKNPSLHVAVVHVPKRKRGRPRKTPRPADAVVPEKTTVEPQRCNKLKRPVGGPLGSCTVSKKSLHVKRNVGRPRTRPTRLEYTPKEQEQPCKSHDVNDSSVACLVPKSPIKTLTRKRGRPRKHPCEESRPKYPSVPLPITDNYLFGGFGFQPSAFDAFAGTPSCDFSLPIEGAVLPVETVPEIEEMPILESVCAPDSMVGAAEESIISQQFVGGHMTGAQWTLEEPKTDRELPELSCCISVTTPPVLPLPPSISIELDSNSQSLPDPAKSQSFDEAINLPATDILDSLLSPPEEEGSDMQLLTEMA